MQQYNINKHHKFLWTHEDTLQRGNKEGPSYWNLKNYNNFWYYCDGLYNILYLSKAKNKLPVMYDSYGKDVLFI